MLPTRSARLAATLLLALLCGWEVRACRQGTVQALPKSPPLPGATAAEDNSPKTTFPDE